MAATTISLFGAGTITKLETLTMLSGSRLGASFIVLVTGFLYAIRHKRERAEGLGHRHPGDDDDRDRSTCPGC